MESLYIVSSLFEQWIWKYLHILKPGDCFIDIGAHIGKYTIQVTRIVGDEGLVLSIEAHSDNYKILVENILINHLTKGSSNSAWKCLF
jgi:tRNA A58 N-methylase Trm61